MGLGFWKRIRIINTYFNLLKFQLYKSILGFDVANQFIQQVDKISLQLILKKNGAKIGKNCDIETGLIFHNCNDYSNLIIGNNCHIGKNCFFDLRNKIEIRDNVVISMQTTFITHIDMSKSELSRKYSQDSKEIVINSNVYVGARATILMGANIGENSFIAAGSLVNKNVEPYSMVGGVPAKLIKKINLEEFYGR